MELPIQASVWCAYDKVANGLGYGKLLLKSGFAIFYLWSLFVQQSTAAQVKEEYDLIIPSSNVANAVKILSFQTGHSVLFLTIDIGSEHTSSISGRYTLVKALNLLLENTNLSGDLTESGVITISQRLSLKEKNRENNVLNKRLKGFLVSGASAVALMTSAPAITAATARDADGEDNVTFEEIIVTAEKRRESVQNIPIAISVFSKRRLESAGVTGISDLKHLAPSVQFGSSATDTFVSIRGIGNEVRNGGAETGVIITQDGVPFTSLYMFDADFLDVERVEILRGPQGTISGRNSTGGVINIHSKRPTEEFEGEFKASMGNYDRFAVEGYISGPLLKDKLLGRLVVRNERADGWLRNSFLNEDENGTDKVSARASFLANLSENLEAILVLEGSIDRASRSPGVDLGRVRADEPGFTEVFAVPGFDPENLEYQADFPNKRRVENYKAILELNWDIGETANIVSTTGYVSYKQEQEGDFDGTIIAVSHFSSLEINAVQFSQELTLTADITDKLDVILGGIYVNSSVDLPFSLGLPLFGIPEGAFEANAEQDLTSLAVYTQFRYIITDTLRVSAGVRYTYDKKDYFEEEFFFGGFFASVTDTESWNAVTPRVAIDYTPTDEMTFYASVSRGFKSGGFNSFPPVPGVANIFEPEYVWNYETGLKANLLDGRLRTGLSGFYADYSDLQQSLLLTPAGGGIPLDIVRNASAATIKGVELEIEALFSNNFRISASGTWLDAEYDKLLSEDPIFPSLGERDLSGNQVIRAPNWQFSISGEYTRMLDNGMLSTLRADYQWQDDMFFSFFNHELNSQKSYGLLNLFASIEQADGRWELAIYARNILDERYTVGTVTQNLGGGNQLFGTIGSPRMYGGSISYRF